MPNEKNPLRAKVQINQPEQKSPKSPVKQVQLK